MTSASGINEIEVDANGESRRWSREPILVSEGSPQRLAKLIPTFERRPFSIAGSSASENKFLDLIVRMPMGPEETETPVAAVSKRYKLVQHPDVFEKACEALKKASIDHDRVSGELTMSVYYALLSVLEPQREIWRRPTKKVLAAFLIVWGAVVCFVVLAFVWNALR